mmetsp:Transcript_130847/g.419625  ORF Transcript_130847/g.419625 Transcript_130847/m.419625 type:complete len:656 (+) Transcript_130847:995-2962(+)
MASADLDLFPALGGLEPSPLRLCPEPSRELSPKSLPSSSTRCKSVFAPVGRARLLALPPLLSLASFLSESFFGPTASPRANCSKSSSASAPPRPTFDLPPPPRPPEPDFESLLLFEPPGDFKFEGEDSEDSEISSSSTNSMSSEPSEPSGDTLILPLLTAASAGVPAADSGFFRGGGLFRMGQDSERLKSPFDSVNEKFALLSPPWSFASVSEKFKLPSAPLPPGFSFCSVSEKFRLASGVGTPPPALRLSRLEPPPPPAACRVCNSDTCSASRSKRLLKSAIEKLPPGLLLPKPMPTFAVPCIWSKSLLRKLLASSTEVTRRSASSSLLDSAAGASPPPSFFGTAASLLAASTAVNRFTACSSFWDRDATAAESAPAAAPLGPSATLAASESRDVCMLNNSCWCLVRLESSCASRPTMSSTCDCTLLLATSSAAPSPLASAASPAPAPAGVEGSASMRPRKPFISSRAPWRSPRSLATASSLDWRSLSRCCSSWAFRAARSSPAPATLFATAPSLPRSCKPSSTLSSRLVSAAVTSSTLALSRLSSPASAISNAASLLEEAAPAADFFNSSRNSFSSPSCSPHRSSIAVTFFAASPSPLSLADRTASISARTLSRSAFSFETSSPAAAFASAGASGGAARSRRAASCASRSLRS